MKRIKNILTYCILASLSLPMSSCNDLEEYNPSGTTADAIWSTPEGFVTAVNAAYFHLRSSMYGKEDGVFIFEAGSDLWIPDNASNRQAQITKYANLVPDNTGQIRTLWREAYRGINQANAGINRIDQAGFTSMVERNRRLGELRFLRALYNWHIVETYGGVNLRTKETQGPELTATRSSVEEFYELIIADLEFAAQHLPNDWGAEYSRATKKSALGLLARAYLSRAYYPSGGNEYFQKARNVANEVINRQGEFGVELWSDYGDIFDPANNKRNKEALFIVSNSRNISLNFDQNSNRLHSFFHMNYSSRPGLQRDMHYGNDGDRRVMPTLALLDFYNEEIDSRYDKSFRELWIANKKHKFSAGEINAFGKDRSLIGHQINIGDTALYVTKQSVPDKASRPYIVVDRNDIYLPNGAVNVGIYGQHFPVLTKYMDPTRDNINSRAGLLDILVIRLAEMYMIAAEAEHQLGNNTEAANKINVLRTRAAWPGREAEMQITPEQVTIDFILDEKAREFAGELQRWYDLKRTGKLIERVRKYNPDITEIQEHHVLRPVPQQDIDALLNGDEFGQNPGY